MELRAMSRLLPIVEAAASLGLSRKTLERECRDGRLVLIKVRWKVYAREEDLKAWLDARPIPFGRRPRAVRRGAR
jgi:excisionase family DNA binding protein